LLSESRVQPVVTVFEDLHFTDSLTLGLLNELVVAAQNARLLVLVSYRPGYRDEWRNRPNYHQLRLDPLGGESLVELLEALLGSDPSLPTLKSFLTERASGNPFFVEEIVRSLVDAGALEGERASYRLVNPLSSIEVPRTVQMVLAARIDALPAAEKRLLEEAAVIGYDAPFTLLRAICGLTEDKLRRLLDNLQATEFLYATQLFPDLQYTFKHSLTHDVTYSGVLHERRRDIHARVVDAIEQLYADRLGEQVERLAHHAVQSELRGKAVHYLRQAGGKAAARSAASDARALFEQAMHLLEVLPDSRAALEQAFEIRLELRPVLRQLGEVGQMLERLREAEALAERLGDDRRRGLVCGLMTTVLSTLDELDEALVTGTRALEIAGRFEDLQLRILTTTCLEQAYYYRGEYARVAEIATENLAVLPSEWVNEYFGLTLTASVASRTWLIMSLAELGRFAEASKYEAEATQIAEPTQHAFTIAWAHFAASILYAIKGDWTEARPRIDHWIAMVRTGNVVALLPWAIAFSAQALAEIGEASEALRRVREGEQLLERQTASGIVGHRGCAYHAVSRACLLLGRIDEARRLADRAVESSRHQPGFAAHAFHLLGDIATHPDRFDAESGAAHYRQAMTLAELHGMRPLLARCHLGMGQLYRRIGETERARENLAAARTMHCEMDMDFRFGRAASDVTNSADLEPGVRPPPKNSWPRP
jgi:tetratricopeptide (TPR) repeat protein